MKKLGFVVFLGLFFFLSGIACAGPFLVCDPYSSSPPEYFRLKMDSAVEIQVPIYGTPPYLHYDVSGVSVGAHTVRVKACKSGDLWSPEVCSVEALFTFTRPSAPVAPAVPTNIGLVP